MARACASWLLALIVLIAAPDCLAQASPCSLSGLSWMAGAWRSADDPEGAQERWAIAPQNVLMGSAWQFSKGQSGYAEIMTVKQDGASIAMLLRHFDGGLTRAWEERNAPMVFTASRCAGESVVFDGQGDHAGEHLTYKRSGANLLIVGDFLHHGTPDHEEWHMVRAGD
jgi:hypothetical protein